MIPKTWDLELLKLKTREEEAFQGGGAEARQQHLRNKGMMTVREKIEYS